MTLLAATAFALRMRAVLEVTIEVDLVDSLLFWVMLTMLLSYTVRDA